MKDEGERDCVCSGANVSVQMRGVQIHVTVIASICIHACPCERGLCLLRVREVAECVGREEGEIRETSPQIWGTGNPL